MRRDNIEIICKYVFALILSIKYLSYNQIFYDTHIYHDPYLRYFFSFSVDIPFFS